MRIRITEVTQRNNHEPCVHFHSDFGKGKAVWEATPPAVDHEYDVEIELNDLFVWGENISATDESPQLQFNLEQGTMKLVAEVVSLEQDGCLAVKIAHTILLLETTGIPLSYAGKIQCKAHQVKLFPVFN